MPSDKTYEPRLLERSDTDSSFYELYQVDDVPNVFVDGISDLLTGPLITQLKLHRIDNVDFGQTKNGMVLEKRILKVNLIIPTIQLIEMAHKILAHYEDNKEVLLQQMKEKFEYANHLLSSENKSND